MNGAARRAPRTEEELEALLSEPRDATVDALRRAPGDLIILGAGGKMGPTLARMARRAAERADGGQVRRVIAVSRFSTRSHVAALHDAGVETIECDLLDVDAVQRLPPAPNVVFMAGQKFGTADVPSRTWMMNVVVPAHCARRYASSRVVAFSTGNVYPLVSVESGGASERTPPAPIGEYAASCLGRERVFEHHAAVDHTPVAIVRLNYAIDLRYGVLADLAQRILEGRPVPLAMGYVNVIWQGDANRIALELLPLAAAPPLVVNVTGETALSVRSLAEALGRRLGKQPLFDGRETSDALLSDTTKLRSMLGAEALSVDTMLGWVADWVAAGRPMLGKATRFETRDGVF